MPFLILCILRNVTLLDMPIRRVLPDLKPYAKCRFRSQRTAGLIFWFQEGFNSEKGMDSYRCEA